MITSTRRYPDDPRLAALGLPRDRDWYRFAARGGHGLPWNVGRAWPRKLDWSGIGTPVDIPHEGSVIELGPPGDGWYAQLWVQHIGDPREELYLEALWHPEERRTRIAMHGLERHPNDAQISSLARARAWFAPDGRADDPE